MTIVCLAEVDQLALKTALRATNELVWRLTVLTRTPSMRTFASPRVGPTRGRARILVDGTYVKTVNLYASSFTARKAVFSKSWTAAGAHTLVIDVVGTAGHPYVAIDGFTVVD